MLRKRRGVMWLAIAATAAATVSGLAPAWGELGWWRLVAIVACAVSVVGIVWSDQLGGSTAIVLAPSDWVAESRPDGPCYVLTIPRSRHGHSTPTAELFERSADGSLEVVFTDTRVRDDGAVVMEAPYPVAGEVRIG